MIMSKKSVRPDFLIIGRVLAPWGRSGEVKVLVETDFPDRFAPGSSVLFNGQPLEVESSRPQKQFLLVKFATINNIQDAEKLKGTELKISRSEIRELPPGEYYIFQLIGLNVLTTEGKELGHIVDIMPTASNDVYIVAADTGEILIPAIDDVVRYIDLDKGQVVIEAIDGLLPS